ncbi:hypothetical protein KUF71_017336 [Frankliniella fusca]|uniref:RNA-directed DNA polymerase n=1 Tax=Frankliniella fusca TaxID=407009 RepID=A0AAE1I7H5_9NEOP|nr:hypothetical protein KUF71_017336 [Frankliniella fusca]
MKFVPGKEIHGPDVLSRRPLKETIPNQDILREEICVAALTEANLMTQPFSEAIWKQVTRAQAEDPTSNQLAATIIKGWPQHPDDLDNQLKPFFSVRGELNIQHSLVCKGNRIYTPKSLQKCFLSRLPEGHLGLEKCRSRAAVSVWWPHLSTQLTQAVEGCEECIRQRKNPKEPLMPTTLPDYPWQMVGADFLHAQGKEYLLIIDYFSTFPFLIPMKKKTAGAVIQELEPLFSIFGAPEIFRSDNGPPFNSFEFEAFCRTWEVTLIISSPRYPRSNGKAEAGVKKMKDILNKCSSMSDTYRGLLAYRDAQLQDGCTPAQLFLGRKTRTLLPVLPAELRPQWPDLPAVKQAHQERIQRAKEHHDRVTRARLLKPLSPEPATEPRSYWVSALGRRYRRNREALIWAPTPTIQRPDFYHYSSSGAAASSAQGASAEGAQRSASPGPPQLTPEVLRPSPPPLTGNTTGSRARGNRVERSRPSGESRLRTSGRRIKRPTSLRDYEL